MDIDSAFYTTLHTDWGIRGNGINPTQTEGEPCKDSNKRKEIKKLNPFLLQWALIQCMKQEEYKNGDMLKIIKNYKEDRNKKSHWWRNYAKAECAAQSNNFCDNKDNEDKEKKDENMSWKPWNHQLFCRLQLESPDVTGAKMEIFNPIHIHHPILWLTWEVQS